MFAFTKSKQNLFASNSVSVSILKLHELMGSKLSSSSDTFVLTFGITSFMEPDFFAKMDSTSVTSVTTDRSNRIAVSMILTSFYKPNFPAFSDILAYFSSIA